MICSFQIPTLDESYIGEIITFVQIEGVGYALVKMKQVEQMIPSIRCFRITTGRQEMKLIRIMYYCTVEQVWTDKRTGETILNKYIHY